MKNAIVFNPAKLNSKYYDGKIVRRWDQSGREGGKERGEHWHDEYGNHILPEGITDN